MAFTPQNETHGSGVQNKQTSPSNHPTSTNQPTKPDQPINETNQPANKSDHRSSNRQPTCMTQEMSG
jgi:hypothetical protein